MAEAKEDEEEVKAHRPLHGSEAEQTLGSLLTLLPALRLTPGPTCSIARGERSSRPVTPPNGRRQPLPWEGYFGL